MTQDGVGTDIHYTAWEATDLEMLALFLLALTRVQSIALVLDSHRDLPEDIETKIYEVFCDTEELSLYGHSAESILAAMADDDRDRSDISMALPFPHLKVLSVHSVDLQLQTVPAFRQLIRVLRTRPLLRLELEHCYNLCEASYQLLSGLTSVTNYSVTGKEHDMRYELILRQQGLYLD
jgi:hypothetical protein